MRTEAFDSTRGSRLDRIIWAWRVRKVRRQIGPRRERIVDLGCGRTAPLLRMLLTGRATRFAIGVDLDPAPDQGTQGLRMLRADLNAPLPIADASADVVLSLAVLEHLLEPLLHLQEIHRILKPAGVLLLTTPSPRGKPVLEFLAYRLGLIDRREIEDHKTYFDTRMLREILSRAGFEPQNTEATTFQFGMNNSVRAKR